MMIPIKVYDNMNNLKLTMLLLNMVLNFMFVCNPKQLQVSQSKLSTYSCFHPFDFDQIEIVLVVFVWWWKLWQWWLWWWQLSLCNMFFFMALVVLFYYCYLWPCSSSSTTTLDCVLLLLLLVVFFYYYFSLPWLLFVICLLPM